MVLGGGPIGSELTQTFARLGSRVTQVEMLPRILVRGSGQLIDAPFLPLKGVGFTVQLQDATSGRCWSADFPGAAVQKNFGGKPGDGSRSDGALTAQMR